MATKGRKGKSSATKPKVSTTSKEFSLDDLKDEEVEALEKEGAFAWQILKKSTIKDLKKFNAEVVMDKLAGIMGLKNWQSDWGTGALLDFYVLSYYWCAQKSFDSRQISAVFTLVNMLMGLIRDGSSLFELTEFLTDTFRGVSTVASQLGSNEQNATAYQNSTESEEGKQTAHQCPIDCISAEQAKSLSEFLTTTILQHYHLYAYGYSETQVEELTSTEYSIQTLPMASVPFPPPLEEAVSEEVYNAYVLTPPGTPEPEEVDPNVVVSGEVEGAEGSRSAESAALLQEMSEKEDEILTELTVDQIRYIVNKLAAQEIGTFQEEYHNKLKEREGAYLQRITKLAKSVDV